MRRVERIDIVLENCEVIEIKAEDTGTIYVGEIYRTIWRVASNSISEIVRSKSVIIELLDRANCSESYANTWSGNEELPFDRLTKHRDICALDIVYTDGTNDYIYVPWGGDDDYENSYQESAVTSEGSLRIRIEEKSEVTA